MTNIPKPNLRVLQKRILFQFEEEMATLVDKKIQQRGFSEVTAAGIIVVSPTTNADKARWGVGIQNGPDCTSAIQCGSGILIEQLLWSNGATVDGQEYWLTDEDKVLCVEDPA